MSSAALRDDDKTLLVTIFKGISTSQMNFDRVGAEMSISKRAAAERYQRLWTKLSGKKLEKEFTLREEDKNLLLTIMKGFSNSDLNFDRVGNNMGISKRAANERYARLKAKLWPKGSTGGDGAVASPAAARSSSAGPVRPKSRKTKEKEINYQEDEGDIGNDDMDMGDAQGSEDSYGDGHEDNLGVGTSAQYGVLDDEASRYLSPTPEIKTPVDLEEESEDVFHDAPQEQEYTGDDTLSDIEA